MIALFGPTGAGKTQVAIELGLLAGVRVISCDSMQLYRGLPVLTNQPSTHERSRVEHALVGVARPDDEWTAARYAERAAPLIEADLRRAGRALVVGGTGLYLRAALAPLAVAPVADPVVRSGLEERGRREGPEVLHAELAAVDPGAAERIHPRNLRRIVRALEVVRRDGPGSWSGREDLWRPLYLHPTLVVGLTMVREQLEVRIATRARAMVEGGAVDEVRRHRAAATGAGSRVGGHEGSSVGGPGGSSARGVAKAIGYAEICALLDGAATQQEVIERIAQATKRYAKRQLTWMRRMEDAVIMDASGREPASLAEEVLERAGEAAARAASTAATTASPAGAATEGAPPADSSSDDEARGGR